jgi:uncharacterized protein HemY
MAEQLSNQAKEHYALEAIKMAHSMIARGDVNSAFAQIREGLKCSNSSKVISLLPLFSSQANLNNSQLQKRQSNRPKLS